MRQPRDPLWRWLWAAALSLPLALAGWWGWLRQPMIEGLVLAVNLISRWLWPDAVLSISLKNHLGLIIMLWPPLTDPPQFFMSLPLSFNRSVVILPLFWGLTLATPGPGLQRRLLLGTVTLLPVALIMALLYVQFQLALYRTHLPTLTEIPPTPYALALPDSATSYYLWGLGRQLAVLVLPVVAPLLVWLWLHGAFLRAAILDGLLHRTRPITPPATSPMDKDPT